LRAATPSSQDNVALALSLAREYDMPRLTHAVEEWLLGAVLARAVMDTPFHKATYPERERLCFARMLSLAREFRLRRFATACVARVRSLDAAEAHAVLELQLREAMEEA
jgi:hypothetical protein